MASKIIYPGNSLLRHSNFLNLRKVTDGIYGKFYRADDWIFVSQKSVVVSEKGKSDGTSRSLDFRSTPKTHESDTQL